MQRTHWLVAVLACAVNFFPWGTARAYFIQFGDPTGIIDSQVFHIKTVTAGTESHNHNGGVTPTGLFLGALTEASAAGGPVNSENDIGFQEIFRRVFVIRRSDPSEPALTSVELAARLMGTLTASPHAVGGSVFADVEARAEVLLNSMSIMAVDFFDTSGGRDFAAVDASGRRQSSLAVDVPYVLSLDLRTSAFTNWDGTTTTTSSSDFLNTLVGQLAIVPAPIPEPFTLPLLGTGLLGLLGYGWQRRMVPPSRPNSREAWRPYWNH